MVGLTKNGLIAATLSITSVCIAVLAVDLALYSRDGLRKTPIKMGFQTPLGFGHCYLSSDPALPIDLSDPHQAAEIESLMLSPFDEIREKTSRCVTYDLARRRAGLHPGRLRHVALLGDSFTFGEGVADEDTLGALMGEEFSTFNFRNYGVSGIDLGLAVDVAQEVVVRQLPRAEHLIFFYNLNDISRTSQTEKNFSYVMDLQNAQYDKIDDVQSWLGQHSTTYRLVQRAWSMRSLTAHTVRAYRDAYIHPDNSVGRDRTIEALQRLAQIAHEADMQLAVVIYPLLHKDILGRYPFSDLHSWFMDKCGGQKLLCIDGATAFEDVARMRPLAVDASDFHPSGRANSLMVQHLARAGLREFLGTGSTEWASPVAIPLGVPSEFVSIHSPYVTISSPKWVRGRFENQGSIASFSIRGAGSVLIRLRSSASKCPDPGGELWPSLQLWSNGEVLAEKKVESEDPIELEFGPVQLNEDLTRFDLYFLDDFESGQCSRELGITGLSLLDAGAPL